MNGGARCEPSEKIAAWLCVETVARHATFVHAADGDYGQRIGLAGCAFANDAHARGYCIGAVDAMPVDGRAVDLDFTATDVQTMDDVVESAYARDAVQS